MFLKASVEGIFAGSATFQRTIVELPQLCLADGQTNDFLIALLMDDFLLEQLIQNGFDVAHPRDQLWTIFIHKVLI